ncbi:MAG: hypothetical protein ACRDRO_09895 [Pseudonocardiaceae bacterium]
MNTDFVRLRGTPETALPIATVGALIRYLRTPVGRYREVLGAVVYRRGATVFTHIPATPRPAWSAGAPTGRWCWDLRRWDRPPAELAAAQTVSDERYAAR